MIGCKKKKKEKNTNENPLNRMLQAVLITKFAQVEIKSKEITITNIMKNHLENHSFLFPLFSARGG